jgi:hypothetical protein
MRESVLILACGALANEIVFLTQQLEKGKTKLDLQCLPADYHNTPEKIVPALRAILDARAGDFRQVLIGYGDCGTGGAIDRLISEYPNTSRLSGAHCYAFYAGLDEFDAMMEEELGSFFLTDYLARHFDNVVWRGLGLDRAPELIDSYFAHYKRIVYLSQADDPQALTKAKAAAEKLGLAFVHRPTAYGLLERSIRRAAAVIG